MNKRQKKKKAKKLQRYLDHLWPTVRATRAYNDALEVFTIETVVYGKSELNPEDVAQAVLDELGLYQTKGIVKR